MKPTEYTSKKVASLYHSYFHSQIDYGTFLEGGGYFG